MNAPVGAPRGSVLDIAAPSGGVGRAQHRPEPETLEFGRLLRCLREGWLRLFGLTSAAALAGLLWAMLVAEPVFRATAVLVLTPEAMGPVASVSGVIPGLAGDSVAVNTEVEILKSRTLLRQLARELDLVADPEFNPFLAPPGPARAGLRALGAWLGLGLAEEATGPEAEFGRTVDGLQDRIAVRAVPESRVFEITAESADPSKAAAIANTLARLYIDAQIARKQEEAGQATEWLTEQVAGLQADLEEADMRARRFAAEMDLVTPETLEALALQLDEIRRRISAREAELARNGTPPARIRAQVAPMREMEAELARRIAHHSEGLVQLGQLQLEAEASRAIYEHFLGRLKEASVRRGIQTSDSRLLSAAEVPTLPSWPQPALVAALAGFLGAAVGAGRLILAEARRQTCRAPQELEAAVGRRVLAVLPRFPARDIVAATQWIARHRASVAAESARALRTELWRTSEVPAQIVLVTSANGCEGEAAVVGALAQSLCDVKRRVLVVDADIRRRGRRWRAAPKEPGLIAVLEGRVPLRKAIVRPRGAPFDMLRAEAPRANATDLLSSRQLDTLAQTARGHYEAVLIRAAPVLAVSDARLLGRVADVMVLVVAWNRTVRADIEGGLQALDDPALPPPAIVMSEARPGRLARPGATARWRRFGRAGYYEV